MEKRVKSIEIRKEDITDDGQYYRGTTVLKEYDPNNLLAKESLNYEEAASNGSFDTSHIKHFKDGRLFKEIITDFSSVHQVGYKYYDNIEIIEKGIILDDKRDVIDRLNEYYIEEFQNTFREEYTDDLKEIKSKYNLMNELVSKTTKYLNAYGEVEKISFEDFKNSANNTVTEISHNDPLLNFANNALLITEITHNNGLLHSKKNSHIFLKKIETISYFEGKDVVQKFEHCVSYKELNKDFKILLKFSRLNDDSFQVDFINVIIGSIENDTLCQKVNLNLDYKNHFEDGVIFKNISDICLFQPFDSTEEIFEKLESLVKQEARFNFYYEKSNKLRILDEMEIFTNIKDSLIKLNDIIPGTLEFESFIKEGSYFNYIEVPYSPNNQDYYIRVSNGYECGYLKIEYY